MTVAVIRQFGSKARVAPQILSLLPADCRTWVEVFAGTAALTLSKPAAWHKAEHLNDLNEEIVGFFRVLRDPALRARLAETVSLTPWSEAEYRQARAEPIVGEPVEDARRFLVRSWQGMAGSSARHTSWIAADRATKRRPRIWHELPERLAHVADRLKLVALHCRPAPEIVARFAGDQDAVLFLDPPYPERAINAQGAYRVTMSDPEHEAFAAQLRSVRACVLMTMAPGTVYDRVLSDWHRLPLAVRGLRNAVKRETIFFNYDPGRAGLFAEMKGLGAGVTRSTNHPGG